jgi:hypothetical protein
VTISRNAPVVVAVSTVLGCASGYISMRTITSGYFHLDAARAFLAILVVTVGVYICIALALLWRSITVRKLFAILGGLLIVILVGAIFAEVGYCYFDRKDCFNL